MYTAPNSNLNPSDSEMEAGFQDDKRRFSPSRNCSKLLELASTNDLAALIHQVEDRGSDINESSFWYGRSFGSRKKMGFEERTPIMIASLYGSTEVLNYIIRTGKVDVNRACGSDGATALHCAAAGGSWSSVEVVELLIAASGDINAVDAGGKKPGDLIPTSVKSSPKSQKKTLEMLLNGTTLFSGEDQEEEGRKALKEGGEKKEHYTTIDVSLPDINNGIYTTDEFRMYNFKVKPCSRAYSHDWTECPFVHPGENARRRDPRKYNYTCVPCPEFKKGSCPKADSCEYAHGVFESWLHPAQYRTRLCKDETGCSRKVCFFAHRKEELRPLYASTGSAMPSPKSVNSSELTTTFSPLSSSMNASTPPISPSIGVSSPMSGGGMWGGKSLAPPALQLSGSRLRSSLNARDVELDMGLLGLEKIRTHQQRQQLVEEMAGLSSPYSRIGDLTPTNLDDVFGSLDPSLLSHLQSPTGLQMRQNMNQLRASYPSNNNISPSPARTHSSVYASGFDSSAAVAVAVMNSRSAAFAKRSQSFVDRSGMGQRAGSPISPGPMRQTNNLPDWGSPNGKLEWGFSGDEVNKLRKSASFGFRGGNVADEPDVSRVNSLVKDVPPRGGGVGDGMMRMMPHWATDQMYIEQEQMVA